MNASINQSINQSINGRQRGILTLQSRRPFYQATDCPFENYVVDPKKNEKKKQELIAAYSLNDRALSRGLDQPIGESLLTSLFTFFLISIRLTS